MDRIPCTETTRKQHCLTNSFNHDLKLRLSSFTLGSVSKLDVLRGEGLVGAVEHVDAVETAAHTVALSLGSAAAQSRQQNNYRQQMFHDDKGTNK